MATQIHYWHGSPETQAPIPHLTAVATQAVAQAMYFLAQANAFHQATLTAKAMNVQLLNASLYTVTLQIVATLALLTPTVTVVNQATPSRLPQPTILPLKA